MTSHVIAGMAALQRPIPHARDGGGTSRPWTYFAVSGGRGSDRSCALAASSLVALLVSASALQMGQ